ncbi:hypothetical protein [Streptomyces sp. NPDC047990]|uniref:hypothetical protein n=1 Tax=Streptomyces sp. NPDC047990 TaxID=3365496 RepID=UPI003721B520
MTDNLDAAPSMIPLNKPGVRWKRSRFDQDAKWVWTPGLLTVYERNVYQFLNIRGGDDRKIFCSREHIAEHVGFSDSSVKRAIAGLKEKGLITYTKVKTSENQKYPTNSYTLYVPAEFAEDLDQSYLNKVLGKSEPEESKSSTKSAPESRSDEIDTSRLQVPGWDSLEAFLEAYSTLPDDQRWPPFPKTWTEAKEEYGVRDHHGLQSVLDYMREDLEKRSA